MSDPFVAEIRIFGFNFAPTGWAQCNGQLLPISQNTALFSLLGTQYGGDGKSNFALPNLQGSVPVHGGQGPGLSEYFIGQSGGTDTITLLESEIPAHPHAMMANNQPGQVNTPAPALTLARSQGGSAYIPANPAPALVNMSFQTLAPTGGSLPHNNLMPYVTLNFCIAMQGIFPPRS